MIGDIILQACRTDKWLTGDWHSCVFNPVPGLVGEGIFGLLIGGALYIALYFAGDGDATTATVVTILIASLLFPVLPSAYVGIAWSALLVGGAAALLQTLQKYVLSPSTI
jgi:hypothetical protein